MNPTGGQPQQRVRAAVPNQQQQQQQQPQQQAQQPQQPAQQQPQTRPLPAQQTAPAATALPKGSRTADQIIELYRKSIPTLNCLPLTAFELLYKIGSGTYGVIWCAEFKATGERFALKQLTSTSAGAYGYHLTNIREITLLHTTKHRNIVTLYDIVCDDTGNTYLVLELALCDLNTYVKTYIHYYQQFLPPSQTPVFPHIKIVLREMLAGLLHLHGHMVIHRDIKSANVLIGLDNHLKVSDFGLARTFGHPQRNMTPQVITLWYRSPELILDVETYTTSVDMWSMGCIFAELALGRVLFPGNTVIQQWLNITELLGIPVIQAWPSVNTQHFLMQYSIQQHYLKQAQQAQENQAQRRFGSMPTVAMKRKIAELSGTTAAAVTTTGSTSTALVPISQQQQKQQQQVDVNLQEHQDKIQSIKNTLLDGVRIPKELTKDTSAIVATCDIDLLGYLTQEDKYNEYIKEVVKESWSFRENQRTEAKKYRTERQSLSNRVVAEREAQREADLQRYYGELDRDNAERNEIGDDGEAGNRSVVSTPGPRSRTLPGPSSYNNNGHDGKNNNKDNNLQDFSSSKMPTMSDLQQQQQQSSNFHLTINPVPNPLSGNRHSSQQYHHKDFGQVFTPQTELPSLAANNSLTIPQHPNGTQPSTQTDSLHDSDRMSLKEHHGQQLMYGNDQMDEGASNNGGGAGVGTKNLLPQTTMLIHHNSYADGATSAHTNNTNNNINNANNFNMSLNGINATTLFTNPRTSKNHSLLHSNTLDTPHEKRSALAGNNNLQQFGVNYQHQQGGVINPFHSAIVTPMTATVPFDQQHVSQQYNSQPQQQQQQLHNPHSLTINLHHNHDQQQQQGLQNNLTSPIFHQATTTQQNQQQQQHLQHNQNRQTPLTRNGTTMFGTTMGLNGAGNGSLLPFPQAQSLPPQQQQQQQFQPNQSIQSIQSLQAQRQTHKPLSFDGLRNTPTTTAPATSNTIMGLAQPTHFGSIGHPIMGPHQTHLTSSLVLQPNSNLLHQPPQHHALNQASFYIPPQQQQHHQQSNHHNYHNSYQSHHQHQHQQQQQQQHHQERAATASPLGPETHSPSESHSLPPHHTAPQQSHHQQSASFKFHGSRSEMTDASEISSTFATPVTANRGRIFFSGSHNHSSDLSAHHHSTRPPPTNLDIHKFQPLPHFDSAHTTQPSSMLYAQPPIEFTSLQQPHGGNKPLPKLQQQSQLVSLLQSQTTLSALGIDLLSRMLTMDPAQRITAEEALAHPWFQEAPYPAPFVIDPLIAAELARIKQVKDQMAEQAAKAALKK